MAPERTSRKRRFLLARLLPDLSLTAKGFVVVALPVCALLVAMAVFYQFEGRMRNAEAWVTHSYEVRGDIRSVLLTVVDAENGARGYILTKQPSFLQQYRAARDRLPQRLEALAGLVNDNPAHEQRLAAIRATIAGIFQSLERLQNETAAKQPTDATSELESSAMKKLRGQFTLMQQAETHLLEERQAAARRAQRRVEAAIFFGGAIGLLGGVLGALLFTTGIGRRVQRLEEEARLVANGVPLEGPVTGRDVIARLERTLQQTSRLLASQSEELRAAQAQLEARVQQRTAELVAANEELRQATEFRQAVVRSSPLAIWAVDLDGNVKFWNPAAERIFGWSEAEVLGGPLPVIPEDQQPEFREWLARFRAGESLAAVERTRRRRDGSTIMVSIWTAPLRDAAGNISGAIAIDNDITEHKQLEQQFRQSQKLEAVGRLAGGVAHDFNNLLTVIMGFVEMLIDEAGDSPNLLEYAREIEYAANRATGLTAQLLAVSRRQVSQPKVLDLNEVVSHSMKLLRRVIGEDIEIATRLDPGLGPVKADPIHIDQIIMNLVVNARDAMENGGKLTIETAAVRLDEEYAGRHIGVRPGNYSMLAISDTGAGMDAETKSRLFEPFFTTKGPGKGTGLGLSIIYGIVKQSGGEIQVYSEPSHGTTFKIYFPVAGAASDSAAGEARRKELRGSETILVCEDESAIRKLVYAMLTRQGYDVIEAGTPEEAVEIARRPGRRIDLLLTDVVMPHANGFELAKQLRLIRPGLKVLYMSGYTGSRVTGTWSLEPGAPFVQKPFTAVSLGENVRKALA